MWIQVRTIDGKETRTVEDLSRLTKIESLRLKIQDIFNVSPHQQRLFYRGKQVNLNFVSTRHATVGFWCFGRLCCWWRYVVLWCCSRFWPMRASCFDRNSPIVLAQEPEVRGVPAPEKKNGDIIWMYSHAMEALQFFGVSTVETRVQQMSNRRRHVCLHCREREKREHRLLFPHVDQSSAVRKKINPHLSPMNLV